MKRPVAFALVALSPGDFPNSPNTPKCVCVYVKIELKWNIECAAG